MNILPVGTLVKVKENLEIDEEYDGYLFIKQMSPYSGCLGVIKFIEKDNPPGYIINGFDESCVWTNPMLIIPLNDEIEKYLKEREFQ